MKIKSGLLCSPGLTNSFKCKIGPVVSNILLSPLRPTFVSPDKLGFVSIETFRGGFHVINPIQSSLAALGCSRPTLTRPRLVDSVVTIVRSNKESLM